MTVPSNVPDWRRRIARANTRTPSPRPAAPARRFMSSEGVVTSELEAPWHTRAGGTRPLLRLSILSYVAALAVSGQLAAIFTMMAIALMPFGLLIVIVFVMVDMMPGGRFIAGTLVGAGLRGSVNARHRTRAEAPGRQLTIASATGDTEELLVASSRRLPAGTGVRAIGPRIFGRRHAWFVRPAGGGLVASKGVGSAVFFAPVLFALSALTVFEAVAR